MKIHLDTDLGGDIDDLCALAMLLRWPDVEITGVTTVAEEGGRRAGYVRRALELEGRREIPVAAGADAPRSLHYYDDRIYWGERVAPAPNPLAEALALLCRSIERGATVVGIGPYTNLSLLEQQHAGILSTVKLFLMGGSISPPPRGFPQWGFEMDYNIQSDVEAARLVFEHSRPTLVPLSATVQTALRRTHLKALRGAGALGRLIARQAEGFARDERMEEKFGLTCSRLPPDIINFQHDALACAVALGWNEGVEIARVPLRMEVRDGLLHQSLDDAGRPLPVVNAIDGERFSQFWIDTLARQAQT
ncbi:MAG TPA: nucleoside hydrolase [Pyrinomonadaceae bacterium]|nr:nucleoside hydrolase [Pyrinomonadaceae bacterium]